MLALIYLRVVSRLLVVDCIWNEWWMWQLSVSSNCSSQWYMMGNCKALLIIIIIIIIIVNRWRLFFTMLSSSFITFSHYHDKDHLEVSRYLSTILMIIIQNLIIWSLLSSDRPVTVVNINLRWDTTSSCSSIDEMWSLIHNNTITRRSDDDDMIIMMMKHVLEVLYVNLDILSLTDIQFTIQVILLWFRGRLTYIIHFLSMDHNETMSVY
jgi:hypothetical protein